MGRKIDKINAKRFVFLDNKIYYSISRQHQAGIPSECSITKETNYGIRNEIKNKLASKLIVGFEINDKIIGNKLIVESKKMGDIRLSHASAAHRAQVVDFKGDYTFAFISIPFKQAPSFSINESFNLDDLHK